MSYVLVVEDEPAVRLLVERLLSRKSFTVHSAATAAEAAATCRELGCPKLMIVDVVLPDTNGAAYLKTVSETCPDTRAILMSGYLPDELREQGYRFDITYLPKPFDNRELLAVVEAAMQS